METAGVEPAPPRCKRGALPFELHPLAMRTGGVEPPQREAAALQAVELAECSASASRGWPTGIEPVPRGSRPRMLAVTPRPPWSGDDRNRTGDLSPDKRVLFSSELP